MRGVPLLLAALLLACQACHGVGDHPACRQKDAGLQIRSDRFFLDGKPLQIISGSMHYFRIHPSHWRDRLQRAAAMGINTVEDPQSLLPSQWLLLAGSVMGQLPSGNVAFGPSAAACAVPTCLPSPLQVYSPWNLHEPYPGEYVWTGFADIERWMALIQEAGLKVLLRPGPYICAEWDNGGFPFWFASSKVAGGRTMRMRTADPAYLDHVGRWWATLFAKLRRYLHNTILMVQIENEYGFCGEDKSYLRHLAGLVRTHLSSDILLFTTDPPGVAPRGTIPGDEVYTVVDFGPGWFDPNYAFGVQKSLNAPGKSPPFCSEFYTGWLTHWGEQMSNTSTEVLLKDTQVLLEYANSTASLSFYMVHGGTNFGFWAGANVDGTRYLPHITSYDYDSPISEAGDYCQPGIGGACKYHALRDLIAQHTGRTLPPVPPRPAIQKYGRVELRDSLPLLDAVEQLYGTDGGVRTELPDIMEEYGQCWGLILYRTHVPVSALDKGATLDVGTPVHDFASVFLDGQLAGRMERSSQGDTSLVLPAQTGRSDGGTVQLDIVVEAMGRNNFGCNVESWDFKGLQSKNVTLNGKVLRGWEVFALSLDDLSTLSYAPGTAGATLLAAARRRMLAAPNLARRNAAAGTTFFRGNFSIDGTTALRGADGHLADTYLAMHGWGKGIAWINSFCLGWFWPSRGPQMTLYVPGPVLREGDNELIVLEVERAAADTAVTLDNEADFHGPGGKGAGMVASLGHRRRRVP